MLGATPVLAHAERGLCGSFPLTSSHMRMTKDTCHGLPPSRAKGGHDPGTSPDPSGHRLRLGPDRYATTITHRLVQARSGAVTDRGPHRRMTAMGGSGATPEGKRLATDIGHRVDTDQEASGLPLCIGGKERVEACIQRQGRTMMLTYIKEMVPMPRWKGGGACGGVGYAFALCGSSDAQQRLEQPKETPANDAKLGVPKDKRPNAGSLERLPVGVSGRLRLADLFLYFLQHRRPLLAKSKFNYLISLVGRAWDRLRLNPVAANKS